MTDLPLRTADLVCSLWRSTAIEEEERAAAAAVPRLGATTRMVHDPDLRFLNTHRDADLPDLIAHLVPFLSTMAERRDDLVSEVRLLREAMVALSRHLEERDDALHRLLEARLDGMDQG
ncbi:MAG TPA: hypothetical protein VFJ85_13320 [Acidimicrobiales bacterium]|nr:hypothetical protein [Acidimicrobiales bacterium]